MYGKRLGFRWVTLPALVREESPARRIIGRTLSKRCVTWECAANGGGVCGDDVRCRAWE